MSKYCTSKIKKTASALPPLASGARPVSPMFGRALLKPNPVRSLRENTFKSGQTNNRCKRAPYHYAVECGNVVRLAREWAHWLTEGKGAFLRVTATQNSRHQALLSVYQRKKREHDRAVEEVSKTSQYRLLLCWYDRGRQIMRMQFFAQQ